MKYLAFAAGMGIVAGAPAHAELFYSNYNPSDTTATVRQEAAPVEYRQPDVTQTFDGGTGASVYCQSSCNDLGAISASLEFTAQSTFNASHIVLPILNFDDLTAPQVRWEIQKLDQTSGSWSVLGYATLDTAVVPATTLEVELPFGVPGAGFDDFSFQPIRFNAGDRYRIFNHWIGGTYGTVAWWYSDEASAPGQSFQYFGDDGNPRTMEMPDALPFQPAFALTDGGDFAVVPEPASWAMMIAGFGLAGTAARRRMGAHRVRLG